MQIVKKGGGANFLDHALKRKKVLYASLSLGPHWYQYWRTSRGPWASMPFHTFATFANEAIASKHLQVQRNLNAGKSLCVNRRAKSEADGRAITKFEGSISVRASITQAHNTNFEGRETLECFRSGTPSWWKAALQRKLRREGRSKEWRTHTMPYDLLWLATRWMQSLFPGNV